MLKVVGASGYRTKVSTCILAGACIVAVGFIFVAEMERPQYSGTYCATESWTPTFGYMENYLGQVNELSLVRIMAARACYKDFGNGWSQFEVETNENYSDKVQAISAGRLEGALTWHNIYTHWINTINNECEDNDDSRQFCTWLRNLISKNVHNVKEMADRKGKHSHFWYQIFLFYKQLEGIEIGFKNGVKRSRNDYEIPSVDFLLMNSAVDIRDLKIYYKQIVNNASSIDLSENKEQILLKVLNDDGYVRLFLGHTTDGSEIKQLRMLKKYTFRYHFSRERENKIIPGTNIIFTGYPGVAASLDDFYLTFGHRQRLIVSGVKIKNRNITLWTEMDIDNSIFLAPRSMAATRLAHNGRSWAKFMAKSPTTGSKQWLIIDSRHLENLETENLEEDYNYMDEDFNEFQRRVSEIKSDGSLFWVVDQIPGRLHAEDVTQRILKDGFWRSDGVPFFEELRKISQVVEPNQQMDLVKPLANVTSLSSLAKVLKMNEFRGTLDKEHLEMKLISETSNSTFQFRAYSGPAFSQINDSEDVTEIDIEPFSWDSVKEIGTDDETDVWSFSQISPKWAWI